MNSSRNLEPVAPYRIAPEVKTSELECVIEDWISSEPIQELVRTWGGSLPRSSVKGRLEFLDSFSEKLWDRRRGKERACSFSPDVSANATDAVNGLASALGMLEESTPLNVRFEYVLVLGGLVDSCAVRASKAAELIAAGIHSQELVALSSFRRLSTIEQEVATNIGFMTPTFEVDVLEAAMKREFGLSKPSSVMRHFEERNINESRSIVQYANSQTLTTIIAAPSSAPKLRRADTRDTFRYWTDHVAELKRGERVLIITSAIYVPFQYFEAISNLVIPFGIEIEVIGVSPSRYVATFPTHRFGPANYLQEIRSAILSARHLFQTIRT